MRLAICGSFTPTSYIPSCRCIPLWVAKPVTAMSRTKRTMASGRTFFPISENDFFTSHRAMVAMSLSAPMDSSGNYPRLPVFIE